MLKSPGSVLVGLLVWLRPDRLSFADLWSSGRRSGYAPWRGDQVGAVWLGLADEHRGQVDRAGDGGSEEDEAADEFRRADVGDVVDQTVHGVLQVLLVMTAALLGRPAGYELLNATCVPTFGNQAIPCNILILIWRVEVGAS
jgi:hypothetical protein